MGVRVTVRSAEGRVGGLRCKKGLKRKGIISGSEFSEALVE